MDIKVPLQSFCKGNKILGVPIEESYKRFNALNKNVYTPYEFEKGLEALGKGVIKNLKKKCSEFIQKECPNSYEAFIERHEFITRMFWADIFKESTPTINHKSKMPSNWDVMSFSEKIDFIKNIDDDREFRAYILAQDPKMKVYFKTYYKPQRNLSEVALSLTDKSPEVISAPEIPEVRSGVDLNTCFAMKTGPVVKLTPKISAPKSHKEKMPVDWLDMNFSERLDFAKAIGDDDFKAYVLAQDPKIKEYLIRLENKKPQEDPYKLYVTLFSFQAKDATPKAKALVKELIGALNKLGRGRLQYVEILDPHIIEIREVK